MTAPRRWTVGCVHVRPIVGSDRWTIDVYDSRGVCRDSDGPSYRDRHEALAAATRLRDKAAKAKRRTR